MRGRPAVRLAGAALVIGAAAGQLHAETVRIRSGEHGNFTRIVAEAAAPEGWALGRAGEGGYELRLGDGAEYDLADAFRLIGRDRIATLAPGTAPGSLMLGLGCDCHATAFVTAGGALVIDVADGPPAAGSPFEARLPAPGTEAGPPQAGPPQAGTAPDDTRGEAEAGHRAPGFAAAATADPRLALFWRGVRPAGDRGVAVEDKASPAAADSPGTDAAPSGSGAPAPANAPAPTPEAEPAPEAEGTATGAARAHPAEATGRDGSAPAEPGATGMPVTPAAEATSVAGAPHLPDSRVTEAQTELLRQLGRAASQGLVDLGTTPHRNRADAPPPPPAAEAGPQADRTAATPEALPVHAETSVDRDAPSVRTRPPVTAEGAPCLPDAPFDIATWGDGRPLAVQLAERRSALVSEFDRPSSEAVVALARLYLHFGFGAESRAVLAAFGITPDDAPVLEGISRIVDGTAPEAEAGLGGMTGCDTAVALWAVMAQPDLPPAADVDTGAVVRTFSALPAHLRRLLGPGLVDRLTSAGAADAARAARNAMARVPNEDGPALDLVEAQIALASGEAEAGERRLDPLAGANDPLSPEALILTIRSRLNRGEAVAPALADSAEALAFERQDGPDGPPFASLHILARASTGEFGTAFAAFRRWPGRPPEAVRAETAGRLFGMLADKADDRTFLALYFGHRDLFEASAPDMLLRLDLGERLARAGFPGEVRRILKGEAAYTERGRRLLARTALDEFDPAEALAQISGLAGPEADRLRAEALALRGDHAAAAAGFGALGEAERAALEAWRAGDLRGPAAAAPEPLRAALDALGRIRPPVPGADAVAPPATSGPLAAGRLLVEEARSAREAVESLLAATPLTAPATPAASGG